MVLVLWCTSTFISSSLPHTCTFCIPSHAHTPTPPTLLSHSCTLFPSPSSPSFPHLLLHTHSCTSTDSSTLILSLSTPSFPPPFLPPLHLHRPGSIQTRPQIEIVQLFDVFLCPLWNFYPPQMSDSTSLSSTFEKYLHNQSLLLHGTEKRDLKYIPKVRVKSGSDFSS